MPDTLAILGNIPATHEEAQQRVRSLVLRHAQTLDEQSDLLGMLGLS